MFPLDLIILCLDISVFVYIPRDPSIAFQSWKTWELHSSGHFEPIGVQKSVGKKKNLVENFPMPRFFSLDWLWEYFFSNWEHQEHCRLRYIA